MDLSIIIVNWNSKYYLRKCIDSILRNVKNFNFEIIVIDNASYDGSCEMLQRHCPQVRFIQSEVNLGFAKANNEAFKESIGRIILFLNPDTELKSGAIQKMAYNLESLPSAGSVGAKLINSNGSIQTSCIQAFPDIMNQVLDTEVLRKIFPNSRLWGIKPLMSGDYKSVEVDVITAACLMIKRTVFEDIGMFSNDYFMYSEDIDICYKIRKAGWKNYFVPSATVLHFGGASSAQVLVNTFSVVMMLESRWRYFLKTKPLWYCCLYRFSMFFSSLIRIGIVLIGWPILKVIGKELLIKNTLRKWVARLKWTLGREEWLKNY